MTEGEAKAKWCPHAVASHTDPRAQTSYSREEIGLPANTFLHACIGSACMAWRWVPAQQENHYGAEKPEGDGWKPGSPNHTRWWWRQTSEPTNGYCGLAGVPQ